MKTTKIILAISMILISLISISIVNAFGIVDIAGVTMYPGETKIVNFNIQNRAGATDDVLVRVELVLGQEVASLEEIDYVVPAGGEVNVPITIAIPENAPIGSSYIISTKTRTIAAGTPGGVGIGIGMSSSFGVVVLTKPAQPAPAEQPTELPEEKSNMIPVVMAIAIIVAIFLIAVILKKRKNSRKK